jgi:DNA repair exonuclease SbcCD nuclease subunit
VLCEFTNHLQRIKSPYYLLLGNHDQYKPNDSKYHALVSYKWNMDHVRVIDSPIHENNMFFIPYINSPEEWPQMSEFKDNELVITHNTFVGAYVNQYKMTEGIAQDQSPADVNIISGHIHKRQILNNVLYVGTPFATSANDVGEEKGVYILNTETSDLQFIRSPFPEWHRIDFDIESMVLATEISKYRDIDVIVLYIVGSKSQINSFLSSKELKDMQKTRKIQIKSTITDSYKTDIKISSSLSLEDMIKNYIKTKYNNTSIDNEITEILDEFNLRATK